MADRSLARSAPVLAALAVLSLLALAVAAGWTGYIASDDTSYYLGAQEWLRRPPFPGVDHWTTRFPLVLSLAAAIGVAGEGALPLALTAVGWYVAFLGATALLAHRLGGARAVPAALLLLGTLPLVATAASTVNCDLPEATFLVLGLWLLADEAKSGRARPPASLAAGVSFGLAILCRETALLPLAGLGVLFVLGRPVSRRSLLAAAAGAALVLGAEMLFQLIVSGDPLHRWGLAFNHDDTLNRAANLEGNLLVHPVIDPLLVLFVNNEFAGLFWLAAAALAAGVVRDLDGAGLRALALPVATGLAAFVLVALLSGKLVLNPRYFVVTAVAAALVVAIWLERLPVKYRAPILAAAVAVNFLMLSVQNAHPRWTSTALVSAAAAHPRDAVSAAPEIVRRTELSRRWAGVTNITAAPNASGLQLVTENEAGGASVVARYPAPPTLLGRALIAANLADLPPQAVRARLVAPGPTMVLVRRR